MAVCTLAVIYMCSDRLRLLHVAGENFDVNAVLADLRLWQVGVCFRLSLRHDRYFVRLSALRGAVQLLLQTVLEPVDHRVARHDDAASVDDDGAMLVPLAQLALDRLEERVLNRLAALAIACLAAAVDALDVQAQVIAAHRRAEQRSVVDAESAFTDVESDAYYADAVQWALRNGVTNGISASAFNPDASCTRAQIVTFLWRTLAA